ncbi:DUF1000-domain-containing protein [Martensiomyces pterosporus]|nr:DUF1000-domain-containing protein [Martensiomyces pterosporus]
MNCHGEANDDDYDVPHSHSHSHGHGHSHGHDHDHDHDNVETGFADSLFTKVLVDEVRCLNESEPDSIKQVFKPWTERLDTTRYVESDADEELLVYVPFNGMVKLKSIFVWGGPTNSSPSELRVFANRDDLDFDNVHETAATQEWQLVEGAREPVEYPTRTAKFNNVRCLTLFFPRNFGADESTVYYLAFRGEWTELKENPLITVYELKPNVADHKTPAGENLGHHTIS